MAVRLHIYGMQTFIQIAMVSISFVALLLQLRREFMSDGNLSQSEPQDFEDEKTTQIDLRAQPPGGHR